MTMIREFDLAVIGAGPAGMAAAATAAQQGLSVCLLDEQPRAGGQIYRDVERVAAQRGDILGPDYQAGLSLVDGLSSEGVTHLAGATVWEVEEDRRILYTRDGAAASVEARRILLATGALERPMPLPGWTLPGVMTVGAGQILLKQSGILPRRAVLVGTGPLLYLLAVQMIRAGQPPLALVETQAMRDLIAALPNLPGALGNWPALAKGLSMLREIRRAGVKRYTGACDIRITGDQQAEAVRFSHRGGSQELPCQTVLLHHGVVPNTNTARMLDIPHRWDNSQQAFLPVADQWGQTPREAVYIAGDGAGIGGAVAAALAGQVSALKIAADLGHLDRDQLHRLSRDPLAGLARERAFRPFLERAYPPAAEGLQPQDDVIICRCEEVTAGAVRQQAQAGCQGPNQLKAFSRAGMGPCQGRYCGLTVSGLMAAATGQAPDQTGYYRIRPPLKPVTLGELAAMQDELEPDIVERSV